jgi:probable rRNA maturation factor
VILNRQSEVRVSLRDAEGFASRLRKALDLGGRDFNVCFVTDSEITRLNSAYRRKKRATDVLSFSWQEGDAVPAPDKEFRRFLGDVVISPRTARRNARAMRHSTRAEIRRLILHGVLHLLGYDHETDNGEMTALEFKLRERLDGNRQQTGTRRQARSRGARKPPARKRTR